MTRAGLLLLGCLLPLAAGAGEPLGRLFLTPSQRAGLEALRVDEAPGNAVGNRGKTAAKPAGVRATAPATVSVAGYVSRSDGKTTVWVDGIPLANEKTADELRSLPLPGIR